MFNYYGKFLMYADVHLDGCRDIKCRVTALMWKGRQMEYEIAWFSNGTLQTAWVAESRLELAR